MPAVLAVLLLAVFVILFQFGYIHHRRPAPSRWTLPELVSNLYTVVMVCVLVTGVGLFVNFILDFRNQTFTLRDVAWMAAVLAGAAAVIWLQRRLWVYWQATDLPVDPYQAGDPANRPRSERRQPQDGARGQPRRAA